MAVGEIYRLTDFQTYGGQVCLNVYFYRQSTAVGSGGAAGCISAWVQDVLPLVIAVQQAGVLHTRVEVLNITDGFEVSSADLVANNQGTRSGEGLPSYAAWGFRLLRGSMLTRHGAKRLVGVSETDVVGNLPVSGFLSNLALTANIFATDIVMTSDSTYQPVIVKRPIVPGSGDPVFSYVIGGQFTYATTQNTRKWFRSGV